MTKFDEKNVREQRFAVVLSTLRFFPPSHQAVKTETGLLKVSSHWVENLKITFTSRYRDQLLPFFIVKSLFKLLNIPQRIKVSAVK